MYKEQGNNGKYRHMIKLWKQLVAQKGNAAYYDLLPFPINLPGGMTMLAFLEKCFNDYIRLCEAVELDSMAIDVAKTLGKTITDVLRSFYNGYPQTAYKLFACGMDSLSESYQLSAICLSNALNDGDVFYRMRTDNCDKETDFFHIPYSLRHCCRTERFSIAGYPCFYVGYSKNDCKVEISQTGSIAKCELHQGEKEIKIVDLTMNPSGSKGTETIPENVFLAYWPLIASCYVVKDLQGAFFKEEYIIPQLLALYIREKYVKEDDCIYGIRYYSVQNSTLDPLGRGENDYRNIMFFTRFSENENYDMDLMRCFAITEIEKLT